MTQLTETERLAERLAPDLLGYFARRVLEPADAADLVGETFLVLWRRTADVPQDPEAARMWAFGVARRVLSTYRRTGVRRAALTAKLRLELEATADEAHTDPRVVALRRALERLDPLDREIIRLVHWDGFSLAEARTYSASGPEPSAAATTARDSGCVRTRCSPSRRTAPIWVATSTSATPPPHKVAGVGVFTALTMMIVGAPVAAIVLLGALSTLGWRRLRRRVGPPEFYLLAVCCAAIGVLAYGVGVAYAAFVHAGPDDAVCPAGRMQSPPDRESLVPLAHDCLYADGRTISSSLGRSTR